MIVNKDPGIFTLLLTMRGSIVPRVLPQIVIVTGVAAAVVFAHQRQLLSVPQVSLTPFVLLGVALSLFLGFRNNAAYERWWEGRRLWGALVHETRALARVADIFLTNDTVRQQLLRLASAFSHALRHNLQKSDDCVAAISQILGPEHGSEIMASRNPADAILREMATLIQHQYRAIRIDSIAAQSLNQQLNQFSSHQAGLERLASTPLPFAYTLLVHRTAYIYCLLLPFGMVETAEWLTPIFVAVVAYCFFGLDALSQQLERPFSSKGLNHLPLEALCRINEISVAEALKQAPPEFLQPTRNVLN